MFVSSYRQHESIATYGIDVRTSPTPDSAAEKSHIRIVIGMGPHPRILHIIPVSPVPLVTLLCLTMSHQAIELLQVVDLHQPASIQLALPPGFKPIVFDFRKKILVAFLQYEKRNSLCDATLLVLLHTPNLSILEVFCLNLKPRQKAEGKEK